VSAFYCAYDCSGADMAPDRRAPTRPGICLQPEMVYATQNSGWLTFVTYNPALEARYFAHWLSLCTGNMTWEGWFRVLQAPTADSMLFGTKGVDHDGNFYNAQQHRRRYAAVEFSTAGKASLKTNIGTSSGMVNGPEHINFLDQAWHHVAAVFSTAGGKRLACKFEIDHFHWAYFRAAKLPYPSVETELHAKLQQQLAHAVRTDTSDAMVVSLEDAILAILYTEDMTRQAKLHFVININPEFADAARARLAAAGRQAVETAINDWWAWIETQPFRGGIQNLLTGDVVARFDGAAGVPSIEDTGSLMLYVDGYPGTHFATYTRTLISVEDNVGWDGQLQIGGVMLGVPVDAEVAHFRLWNQALDSAQLNELGQCRPSKSIGAILGGASPHMLEASYPLGMTGGNNSIGPSYEGTSSFSNLEMVGGAFVQGGRCGPDGHCPYFSSDGCPLQHEVNFSRKENCDAYASWIYSSKSGIKRDDPVSAGQGQVAYITPPM